jgi:Flp pilus assembly pilin Flp
MFRIIVARMVGVGNDNRGLETLEYAVFAAAFLAVIAGVFSVFAPGISSTYSTIGAFVSNTANGM